MFSGRQYSRMGMTGTGKSEGSFALLILSISLAMFMSGLDGDTNGPARESLREQISLLPVWKNNSAEQIADGY